MIENNHLEADAAVAILVESVEDEVSVWTGICSVSNTIHRIHLSQRRRGEGGQRLKHTRRRGRMLQTFSDGQLQTSGKGHYECSTFQFSPYIFPKSENF